MQEGELLPPFDTLDDLHESADIVQKVRRSGLRQLPPLTSRTQLHFIATELPSGKFALAKERIEEKMLEVEQLLLAGFRRAFGNVEKMKAYAHTLYPFKVCKCLLSL